MLQTKFRSSLFYRVTAGILGVNKALASVNKAADWLPATTIITKQSPPHRKPPLRRQPPPYLNHIASTASPACLHSVAHLHCIASTALPATSPASTTPQNDVDPSCWDFFAWWQMTI